MQILLIYLCLYSDHVNKSIACFFAGFVNNIVENKFGDGVVTAQPGSDAGGIGLCSVST